MLGAPLARAGDTVENKGTMAIGIGALLLLVNVGMAATGFVDNLIQGNVETLVAEGYDGLDEDGNEDYTFDFDEEWLNPSSQKAYFANSISNLDEVQAGADPTYERVGPFIFYENTTREILDFDYAEKSITYSGYEVFEWCEDCTWTDDQGVEHASVSGDTVVNQINILWNTQRMGGMGPGIEYGEIFAKAMFAAQMIEFDLKNRAPSVWASDDIEATAVAAGGGKFVFGNMSAVAEYAMLNESFAGTDGSSGVGNWNTSVIKSIFYNAQDADGNCIALTCDMGPLLIAGMGAPSDTVTPVRAALLGYSGSEDPAEIQSTDLAVYSLAASKFASLGGGAEINDQTPQLDERFETASGITVGAWDEGVLENLLFNDSVGLLSSVEISGIPLPGMVVGLLLPLQEGDYFAAMETYGLGLLTIGALADYVVPWVGLEIGGYIPMEFELILTGGQGTMNSNDWWLTAFGDFDPLGGTHIPIGLNRGDFVGSAALSMEKSDFILNDPVIGLKGDFPRAFMFGELSGMSLPDSEGVQHVWDDAYVASLYDIPVEAAQALRDWVANFYFDIVMPVLLNFVTGNTAYYSMPISNWLYGWDDAVSAYFGFFSWNSLETNATYYGSGGISTGDRSVYKMSTAEETRGQRMAQGYINSDGDGTCDFDYDSSGAFIGYDLPCDPGQVYGMTEHLTWRAPHREEGASGGHAASALLTNHAGNNETSLMGTVGGLASPNDPFNLNVAGYAIGTSVVGGETTYKGIDMIEHTVTVNPSNTQIQGKLIGSSTFVDVIPGALPVYLEANIDLKVEPITTAIMYGKAEVVFHLDLRGPGNLNPDISENSTESMPVFEIHTFSEIDDEGAANYTGLVSENLGPMGWTNFGGDAGAPLVYLHVAIAMMYIGAIGSIGWGLSIPETRSMLGLGGGVAKGPEDETGIEEQE
ncbi:MAG: hypothetical protein CMB78_06540 [Euryarchaeota archaeon]|nr:hypothetical protein [Euryarchaeota archaeon]